MRILVDPRGTDRIQIVETELISEDQVIKFIDALILAKDFVWPTAPEAGPEASSGGTDPDALDLGRALRGSDWKPFDVAGLAEARRDEWGRPGDHQKPSAPRAKKPPRK